VPNVWGEKSSASVAELLQPLQNFFFKKVLENENYVRKKKGVFILFLKK
jgi:hypothetical protein